jgi:hypothetical protein
LEKRKIKGQNYGIGDVSLFPTAIHGEFVKL